MATNEKVFKINGEEIVVDGDLHNTLNQLARRFYRLLEAYHFHLSVGLQ